MLTGTQTATKHTTSFLSVLMNKFHNSLCHTGQKVETHTIQHPSVERGEETDANIHYTFLIHLNVRLYFLGIKFYKVSVRYGNLLGTIHSYTCHFCSALSPKPETESHLAKFKNPYRTNRSLHALPFAPDHTSLSFLGININPTQGFIKSKQPSGSTSQSCVVNDSMKQSSG